MNIWSEDTASAKVLRQRFDCIVGERAKRPVWPRVSEREREM